MDRNPHFILHSFQLKQTKTLKAMGTLSWSPGPLRASPTQKVTRPRRFPTGSHSESAANHRLAGGKETATLSRAAQAQIWDGRAHSGGTLEACPPLGRAPNDGCHLMEPCHQER